MQGHFCYLWSLYKSREKYLLLKFIYCRLTHFSSVHFNMSYAPAFRINKCCEIILIRGDDQVFTCSRVRNVVGKMFINRHSNMFMGKDHGI